MLPRKYRFGVFLPVIARRHAVSGLEAFIKKVLIGRADFMTDGLNRIIGIDEECGSCLQSLVQLRLLKGFSGLLL